MPDGTEACYVSVLGIGFAHFSGASLVLGSIIAIIKQDNITIQSKRSVIEIMHCVPFVLCHVLLFRLESYLHRGRATPPSGLIPGTANIEVMQLTPKHSNNELFRLMPIRNKTTPAHHRRSDIITLPHPSHHAQPSIPSVYLRNLSLLVDPVVLGRLPALDLALLEPESDLLLSVLDRVGAVAHVAADVEGEVAADGAGGGRERVGGAEDGAAGLDGVAAFPDHGADGAGAHVYGVLAWIWWGRGIGARGQRWAEGLGTYRQLARGRRACRQGPRSASGGAPWRG
jgi:hypothetical protein